MNREQEKKFKIINGEPVEYLDVVHHRTTTKFKGWDKIKILFGREVIVNSQLFTKHEHCQVICSEAIAHVAPMIKRKSTGKGMALSENPELVKNLLP